MPRFTIKFKSPILYKDIETFLDYVLMHTQNKTKKIKNLRKSSACEGGFSCIDRCDIRFSGVLHEYIDSLWSKECLYNEQEWSNDEIKEFNTIINSYFTELKLKKIMIKHYITMNSELKGKQFYYDRYVGVFIFPDGFEPETDPDAKTEAEIEAEIETEIEAELNTVVLYA